MNNDQFIQQLARCPKCFTANLDWQEDRVHCTHCDASYTYLRGRPVLMNEASRELIADELNSETGGAMQAEYSSIEQQSQIEEKPGFSVKKLITPPDIFYYPNPDLQAPETRPIFDHQGPDTKILNVGGGPIRYGNEISLNLQPFVNVNVVGDAHNIPFEDNSFDSIICNAVLEHVPNPQRVVDEFIRVLKPGGLVYVEVPFLFFYHGYPNDYHRFTQHGLKNMLSDLDTVQFGITQGPVSALLLSLNHLLTLILPWSDTKLSKVYNGVFRWLFFPFKYIDKWLNKKSESHVLAGGFYILARKQLATD